MTEQFFKEIRDPAGIWYGPHQCPSCGKLVVRKSLEQGGMMLDAEDFNHHYPNFPWVEHQCKKSPSIQSKGGKARAAALTSQERSEIAREAANQRWQNEKDQATPPDEVAPESP